MTSGRRAPYRPQLFTLLILSGLWFAVPHAGPEDDSDQFLLFTSDRDNPSEAGICASCEDIYVMPPAGELPGAPVAIRLTSGGGVDPESYNSGGADWSRAKLIGFQSNRIDRVPQIFTMNQDGTNQQLLVSLPRGGAFPSFSPSGNELCFHSQTAPRRDIYIVNVHGTGLTNLTSPSQLPGQTGTTGNNLRCDWSPKGGGIAFSSTRHDLAGEAANDEIYVMNVDGSGVVRLTEVAGSDVNPAWSPKGDRIAFESNRTGKPEIWAMNADGSDQTRLTYFDAEITPSNVNVTKPTWSPKGDRIAFHRRVTDVEGTRGHFEIYTMNADGTDRRQITFTSDPGFSGFPSWGKRGSE